MRRPAWIAVFGALCGSALAEGQAWTEITPAGGPIGTNTPWTQGACYDPASNRLTVHIPPVPPVFPSQVWVLTNANGEGGPAEWIQLAPTGGAPDDDFKGAGIACDPDNNRMIVYGGYGGCPSLCGSTASAVRVLSHANGLGGTPAWTLNTVSVARPRTAHSAVLDAAGDRLITFGGAGATVGTDQNDVAVLSNASGSSSPSVWTTLTPLGTPPPAREDHRAVYDAANNTMLVFAGRKVTSFTPVTIEDYNDVWVLTHANGTGGTPAWTQLATAGTPPISRSSHSATYDAANHRLIVFGGQHWDPVALESQRRGDLSILENADGVGGTPTWRRRMAVSIPPLLFGPHGAAFDDASGRLVVAGALSNVLRVWLARVP